MYSYFLQRLLFIIDFHHHFSFGKFILKILFPVIAFTLAAEQPESLSREADKAGEPKYIFLFIGDGIGYSQIAVTEKALPGLCFNTLRVRGAQKTCSFGGKVTDSAAAVTALACGYKTRNGILGLDPDGKVIESVAETAKKKGWKIGIISSVPLNHATPAGFYAHCPRRNLYNRIINDLAASGFDYFGGNSFIFSDKSKRKELETELCGAGYLLLPAKPDMDFALEPGKKYIVHQELPFVIDSNPDSGMTLADFTRQGIRQLYQGSGKTHGFFMMVEGGKIDWSCHVNDTAGMIREVKDFDRAVKVGLDFCGQHPKSTTVIVTADHETGGLQFVSGFHPETGLSPLLRQQHSYAFMSRKIRKLKKQQVPLEKVLAILKADYGVPDFSAAETQELAAAWNTPRNQNRILYASYEPLLFCIQRLLCRRCGLKWSTTSHTAENVPVFAAGIDSNIFSGVYENTQIAAKIRALISGR
ncbi:MAG: alkaline phosphatase [Victivallales bacterium]|nr:alkaline phosphatase [Victivallales bacterium]